MDESNSNQILKYTQEVKKNSLDSNHTIKEEDITYKRPGTGISPIFWDDILGKKIRVDLPKDHLLKWSDLES